MNVLVSIEAAKMYGTSIAGQSSWENPEKISSLVDAARVRFETDVVRTPDRTVQYSMAIANSFRADNGFEIPLYCTLEKILFYH